MASENQILAPNYTQIPNVIFDYWMERLSPSEFKVLLCLCRKIFGWHKTSDEISKNQIMRVTGLSKSSVQTAIEGLEKHNLIIKISRKGEYGHLPNTYSLNIKKGIDERYSEPDLGGGSAEFAPGVGQNLTQGVGQNLTPQKKDSPKERKEEKKYIKKEQKGESAKAEPPDPSGSPPIYFGFSLSDDGKKVIYRNKHGVLPAMSREAAEDLFKEYDQPYIQEVLDAVIDYSLVKEKKIRNTAANARNFIRLQKLKGFLPARFKGQLTANQKQQLEEQAEANKRILEEQCKK